MCKVCDFYNKLVPASKSAPALDETGQRTIYGYFDEEDANILANHYPKVGQETIKKIAGFINHPRLLEVAGLVELIERYLERSFSTIRGVTFEVVSNPLSILFWSTRDKTVHRVKTFETELLHGPMEKMSLRRGSLDAINAFLGNRYGLTLTFGCSCCAIAVSEENLTDLYESDYYRTREGLGRQFDSDVLTTLGQLFEGVSVADVPDRILSASADFGQPEVQSYIRFANAAKECIVANPVTPDQNASLEAARLFLTGGEHVIHEQALIPV